MFGRNSQARSERKQEQINSGFIFTHFPEVARIVISMRYKQKGARVILRTLYFSPDSYAFFKVTCLSDDCVDGGFDLTRIITSMIRNHSEASTGEIECDDSGPQHGHSHSDYEIAIQYT